ncbi:leucine-rich repeat-containing protein 72 isoform X1 [Ornithorhynchus anatinus]|uniref:Leucine rich repeat containing 72 n=1 Tax=Ornithorhynchus anatinus TaxID=9258 RepID=K7EGI0_ORNAN|nr:leucine-rich repeat-containing protein 72 isoform X1 [Ornithorhynchus anatinus]
MNRKTYGKPVTASQQAIEDQLKIHTLKRDVDVSELFLCQKGLKEVIDLSCFQRLKYLWLNHNKLREIKFLTRNYCLTELYLNDNEIFDITGLRCLDLLQILLLHNNQIQNLEASVKELKGMMYLQKLTLYHNPMSQSSEYRFYTIYHLPAVQLLDKRNVTQKERESALFIFDHKKASIVQSIAFGKRIDIPLVCVTASRRRPRPAQTSTAPADSEFDSHRNKALLGDLEDAAFVREMKRSVMQFSMVDWNSIPTREEKHLGIKPAEPAQLLKVLFR